MASEAFVYSASCRYAGTADLVARTPDGRLVLAARDLWERIGRSYLAEVPA